MIATHSVKALDSRFKQAAIRVVLDKELMPKKVLASHLLPLKFFAAPTNAADMRDARQSVEQANADLTNLDELGFVIPEIMDGNIKQVLIPDPEYGYVGVTPVPSLAVIDCINKTKFSFPSLYHRIESVPAAYANHGDPICSNGGMVKLLRNKIIRKKNTELIDLDQEVVLFTAEAVGMNISSSYVSVGLPSLTSIGGMVHVLERETGFDLPFAVGILSVSSMRFNKKGGATARKIPKENLTKSSIFSDEITANVVLSIAIKFSDRTNANKIMSALKKINRIGGGAVFNTAAVVTDKVDSSIQWYQADDDPFVLSSFNDYIQCLSENDYYRIVQTGYAALNEPVASNMSRGDVHVWAEPVFSLIKLGELKNFFSLRREGNTYFWDADD